MRIVQYNRGHGGVVLGVVVLDMVQLCPRRPVLCVAVVVMPLFLGYMESF